MVGTVTRARVPLRRRPHSGIDPNGTCPKCQAELHAASSAASLIPAPNSNAPAGPGTHLSQGREKRLHLLRIRMTIEKDTAPLHTLSRTPLVPRPHLRLRATPTPARPSKTFSRSSYFHEALAAILSRKPVSPFPHFLDLLRPFFPRRQHLKRPLRRILLSIPGLRFTAKIFATCPRNFLPRSSRPILASSKTTATHGRFQRRTASRTSAGNLRLCCCETPRSDLAARYRHSQAILLWARSTSKISQMPSPAASCRWSTRRWAQRSIRSRQNPKARSAPHLHRHRHRPRRRALSRRPAPHSRSGCAQVRQHSGTMMTFAEDPGFDKEQLRRFHETARSRKDGIALGTKHAASSFTLFQHPEAFLDMVRPAWPFTHLF